MHKLWRKTLGKRRSGKRLAVTTLAFLAMVMPGKSQRNSGDLGELGNEVKISFLKGFFGQVILFAVGQSDNAGLAVFTALHFFESLYSDSKTVNLHGAPQGAGAGAAPAAGSSSDAPSVLRRAAGDTLRLYVANAAADLPGSFQSVDVFDIENNTLIAQIPIGAGFTASADPVALAVSPDGSRVVVAVRGTDTRSDPRPPVTSHLAVIDTAANQVARRIDFASSREWPTSVRILPDGSTAVVAMRESDTNYLQTGLSVAFVDLDSGQELTRLPLSTGSSGELLDTAVTPDGALFWVKGPDGLYVVDTLTQTLTATIPGFLSGAGNRFTGSTAQDLAMDPSGQKLYVADIFVPGENPGDPLQRAIAIVDVSTAQLEDYIVIPGAQGGTRQQVGISADGGLLMHLDSISGQITYMRPQSREILDTTNIGFPAFWAEIVAVP